MKEEEFLQQINAKDMTAFKRLFGEFYNTLVLYAMDFVKRQDVAEDIVQDLFVAIWERETAYATYTSFKTFLYTSVRNACLNYLKHQDVEQRYIDSLGDEQEESIDFKIMEEELYRLLFAVIDELPPRCREIFDLHLQGKGNEEIADFLNLSVQTVKTQKKRAMSYLRERLGGMYFVLLAMEILPWEKMC